MCTCTHTLTYCCSIPMFHSSSGSSWNHKFQYLIVYCCLQDGKTALMVTTSEVADSLIAASAKLDLQDQVEESGVACMQ